MKQGPELRAEGQGQTLRSATQQRCVCSGASPLSVAGGGGGGGGGSGGSSSRLVRNADPRPAPRPAESGSTG